MPKKTLKGYELQERLVNRGVIIDVETCSLIARHATSYRNNQIDDCNGHPVNWRRDWAKHHSHFTNEELSQLNTDFAAMVEKKEAQLRRRICELVKQSKGIKAVRFEGDPRGPSLRLIPEEGYRADIPMHSQPFEIAV